MYLFFDSYFISLSWYRYIFSSNSLSLSLSLSLSSRLLLLQILFIHFIYSVVPLYSLVVRYITNYFFSVFHMRVRNHNQLIFIVINRKEVDYKRFKLSYNILFVLILQHRMFKHCIVSFQIDYILEYLSIGKMNKTFSMEK